MTSARGPIYLDTSALIKLYLPEPGSADLEALLIDRRDLVVSDLVITEFTSALGRRKRAGDLPSETAGDLYRTLLDDAISNGYYLRPTSSPEIHRIAERLLLSVGSELRAADALHLGLATANEARSIATFDRRLRHAAPGMGLAVLPEL